MTEASMEAGFAISPSFKALSTNNLTSLLEYIPYIHYQVRFKKNQAKIKALLDFAYKVNDITPTYMAKLGFKVQTINV